MEIWKDIKGYDFPYQVSNLGNVRNVSFRNTGRIKNLILEKHDKGYLRARLMLNGKQKNVRVHRLVAEAFIPNIANKPQVNHKDENKENNHVSNLEWVTNKENSNYGTKPERTVKTLKEIGIYLKLAELKSVPVIAIPIDTNGDSKYYHSIQSTKKDGFVPSSVSNALAGRAKTYRGYKWEYAEERRA